MSVHHTKEKREWLGKHKGGMMYFLGCHDVDLIYRLQGAPLEVIPMNASTGQDGVVSEDFGFCVFRYPNGASFVKTCAAEFNGFERRQLVVTGTKGTVEIRPIETYENAPPGKMLSYARITTAPTEGNVWRKGGEKIVSEPFHRYEAMMEHFARQVRGERDTVYTPDYEWELFRLVMLASGISL
jgi:predicted dehydrogenase